MSNKYDIFISYRRENGAQYARTLQLMLEKKGYKVFLDYNELIDGPFSPKIIEAIKEAPVYIIVLTKGAMARCVNEGDWVRREIEIALEEGTHTIPINADGSFDGVPDGVPSNIKEAIESIQHSEINFGQSLNATVDLMVKNRIKPYIHKHDYKKWIIGLVAIFVILIAIFICVRIQNKNELENLKQSITFEGNLVEFSDNITYDQLLAVKEIMESMKLIEGGTFLQGASPLDDGTYHEYVEQEFETPAKESKVESFYISQFEISVGQWNAIMNDNREGSPDMPVTSITFEEAQEFAKNLSDLTTKLYRLPTEAEWEYAARGGTAKDNYMFAGSEDPDEVAWYSHNSGGKLHANVQGDLRPACTSDDLFNMSGNVSEWCNTKFVPYETNISVNDERAMTIRGGNYDSEPYEITVTHREPTLPDASFPTLGFRIALTK